MKQIPHTMTLALSVALSLAAAGSAMAQGAGVVEMPTQAAQAANTPWTDADYARARATLPRALTLPATMFDYNAAVEAAGQAMSQGDGRSGRGGADARSLREQRVLGVLPSGSQADAAAEAPDAVGTGNLHFSSTRVYPNSSDTTYPTRTVGKLFFKKQNGASYMCSGSMIKPGVVVTAGHCVHSGNGSATGWYNSFQFIPGYRKVGAVDTRPYGTWTSYASVRTSTTWFSGGGGVPNARDYAIIVFNRNASGLNIGNYTGWLGYQTGMMIGRQNSVLGYPGNLDEGGQMHRVESLVTNYGSLNNGTWGSDMQGGSSGGPVVMNFRKDYADSSVLPSENNGNRVTSVVSWGYINPAVKVQGGSQLDSTFHTMVTNACTAFPAAC